MPITTLFRFYRKLVWGEEDSYAVDVSDIVLIVDEIEGQQEDLVAELFDSV